MWALHVYRVEDAAALAERRELSGRWNREVLSRFAFRHTVLRGYLRV